MTTPNKRLLFLSKTYGRFSLKLLYEALNLIWIAKQAFIHISKLLIVLMKNQMSTVEETTMHPRCPKEWKSNGATCQNINVHVVNTDSYMLRPT